MIMEYILIFISAIFVNNIVLSQFLGICPFLGVSKKVETALGMSAAVAFVLTIATIVTFLIQKYVLDAFDLGYLQTITFILVIAALVQMVEIVYVRGLDSLRIAKVKPLPCIKVRSTWRYQKRIKESERWLWNQPMHRQLPVQCRLF